MSLTSTIKRGFITDLTLPMPGTNGKSGEEIERLGLETGIEIMHDVLNWPRMNPLVHKVEYANLDKPKKFDVHALAAEFGVDQEAEHALSPFTVCEITDKLNVAFGYKTDLIYQSAMRKTQDGMEGLTDPGSGVRIFGKFALNKSEKDPSVLHLTEVVDIRCNVFLAVYIKATLGSSHKAMHENFKKKWNEEMKRKLALRF